jgi:hypothetical protein
VGRHSHIDKINHDQAAQVPEPQLPGKFFGGLHIGLENGLYVVSTGGIKSLARAVENLIMQWGKEEKGLPEVVSKVSYTVVNTVEKLFDIVDLVLER